MGVREGYTDCVRWAEVWQGAEWQALAGWKCEVDLTVILPEYITQPRLREVLGMAGRLIGVGDFRPTYGRFSMTKFEVLGLG